MSGSTIGGVIGAAVGYYFGGVQGAQIGFAVGSAIGGYVDPTRINGPHIGDGQAQTASDGSPIAWVMGTAKVAGTLCWVGPRTEVKVQDSGKGSGEVVSHYESRQSFAILVCESDELRDSQVTSVVMVEQDGKIVFDVRPGSTMVAESVKWARHVNFNFGAEDQLPDPVMELENGIGNNPAYRGVLTVVFDKFNTYAAGDRIPQFLFTISSENTVVVNDNVLSDNFLDNTLNPAPPHDQDHLIGYYQDFPVDKLTGDQLRVIGGGNWAFQRAYIEPLLDNGIAIDSTPHAITGDDSPGYIKPHNAMYDTGWIYFWGNAIDAPGIDVINQYFQDQGMAIPYVEAHPPPPELEVGLFANVAGVRIVQLAYFGGFDAIWNPFEVTFANSDGHDLIQIGDGYYKDRQGNAVYRPSFRPSYGTITVTPGALALSQVVQRLCKRGGLQPTEIDTSDLAGLEVLGYPLATVGTAVDCLSPLLAGYFTAGSEYDGQLHFRKLGADAVLVVDESDVIVSDTGADGGSIVSTKRNQATEFPKTITVGYYDPATNYTAATVSEQRSSSDVIAIGEQSVGIPVVMPADQARQAAAKAMKVAYAQLEGTRNFSVPYIGGTGARYLEMAPGDCLMLRGKRYSVDKMTISHDVIGLETTYNRQSAYNSNAVAIVGNPPLPPTTNFSGPTGIAAFNLPALRPQDTYGLYVGVWGVWAGWRGCTVQISYDQGATWRNAFQGYDRTITGVVLEDQDSSGATLRVSVDGNLDSVTSQQIAAQLNAATVGIPGGTQEIIQFMTATEDSSGDYELSDLTRGGLGTPEFSHVAGEQFALLNAVYFVPIDTSLAGATIYLRAISFGQPVETAAQMQIVYTPDTDIIYNGGGDP